MMHCLTVCRPNILVSVCLFFPHTQFTSNFSYGFSFHSISCINKNSRTYFSVWCTLIDGQRFVWISSKKKRKSFHNIIKKGGEIEVKRNRENLLSDIFQRKKYVSIYIYIRKSVLGQVRLQWPPYNLPIVLQGMSGILLLNIWVIASSRSPTSKQATQNV